MKREAAQIGRVDDGRAGAGVDQEGGGLAVQHDRDRMVAARQRLHRNEREARAAVLRRHGRSAGRMGDQQGRPGRGRQQDIRRDRAG
jgi:hypothetical protein